MRRTTITMDGCGRVTVPSDTTSMDERNGIGGTFRRNRPDTPCRYPSRVQKRSVELLRGGKTHQADQRMFHGCVRLANGRGTRFPYQYSKCGNGA